jgi:homocysteine S-methyltransferase
MAEGAEAASVIHSEAPQQPPMPGLGPARGQPLLLDGGLATQCEAMGADLSGGLWSARLLRDEPELLRRAHAAFLAAGCEVCISASYQCSVPSLVERLGIDATEAEALIVSSVRLAREACAADGRHGLLVAGSIGPYGACLADGSEYTGAYREHMSARALTEWHRRRFELLLCADVLAMETIPCLVECQALLALLASKPGARAWISFACQSEARLNSGEALVEAVDLIEERDPGPDHQVQAIGINCTAPRHVRPLLEAIRARIAPTRRLLLYPNSGESWDSASCTWCDDPDGEELAPLVHGLACTAAASGETTFGLVGGCCRVLPKHIAQLRQLLDNTKH